MNPPAVDVFEQARPRLRSMAYRMVGVMADADDIVQEAWLRWSGTTRDEIVVPDAWLNTVTSRLALDHLRRRTREQAHYVGPWLPEPLVSVDDMHDPEQRAELADSLTLGFLILLEELTPDERAAFLMADVFGESAAAIASTLQRSEQACRQLASRGRRKLRASSDRPQPSATGVAKACVDRFLFALVSGDQVGAMECLHPDVRVLSDGGPNRHAARRPVIGIARVTRFMLNLSKRIDPMWLVQSANVGGLAGIVVSESDAANSETVMAMAFRVVDNKIVEVFSVLNPDKLSGTVGGGRVELPRNPTV